MRLMVLPVVVACATAVSVCPSSALAAPVPTASRTDAGVVYQATNRPPQLANLTARIGRVYEEGRGWKSGGLQLRFGVCDDGPQNTSRRWALLTIVHRWKDGTGSWRSKRESIPLITYDISFDQEQCIRRVSYGSVVPANLASYTCYEIAVRVRDPAGAWSNTAKRTVRACPSPTNPPVFACSDGTDNDSDAKTDYPNDPGCTSASDTSETDTVAAATQCSDLIDNDNDGKVDYPNDPDCATSLGVTETGVTAPSTPAPPPPAAGGCDPAYPSVCIPPAPPDLDCGDVPYTNFVVLPPDPHNFDGNHDGVGCEG